MDNLGLRFVMALEHHNMFESPEHRARFGDLVECYSSYPFFTPGLCKCMYLGSWDEEHFFEMLSILNALTLGKTENTEEMEDNGRLEEEIKEGRDREIYRLSGAFLTDSPYTLQPEGVDAEGIYIINQGLKAAVIIDEVMEETASEDQE